MANATNTIAEGEVLQLMNCNDPNINEENYLKVIRYKTSKLFEASCQLPIAVLSPSEDIEHKAGLYGIHLGTAFQLTDDILDYVGSEEDIGKKLGDDLREGKPTLPLIRVASTCNNLNKKKIEDAIQNPNQDKLEEIVDLIKQSDAIEYTNQLVGKECSLARKSLDYFSDSQSKLTLLDLITFVKNRKN